MTDKEFYDNLNELMVQLLKGVPNIVVDIGLLNDTLMEITARRKACKND